VLVGWGVGDWEWCLGCRRVGLASILIIADDNTGMSTVR